jgi:hypothetical protein
LCGDDDPLRRLELVEVEHTPGGTLFLCYR